MSRASVSHAWRAILMRVALVGLLAGGGAAQQEIIEAGGNHPEMVRLAEEMDEKLALPLFAKVLVLDFTGKDGQGIGLLGRYLALELGSALESFRSEDRVIDQQEIMEDLKQRGVSPVALQDSRAAIQIARLAGADVIILGVVEVGKRDYRVQVDAWDTRREKRLARLRTSVKKSPVLIRLQDGSDSKVVRRQGRPAPNICAGALRWPDEQLSSSVSCLHCPDPVYTQAARSAKYSGTVLLEVRIGTDGKVKDVAVLRRGKYGLTEAAIEIVRHWQFKPAIKTDGTPAEICVPVEFRFETL